MASTRLRAVLVGMRFYGLSIEDAVSAVDGAELRREPDNPHDRNAIAVIKSGKLVGHIDKNTAAKVAPALDSGADCKVEIDSRRTRTSRSIPLTLILSKSGPVPPVPSVCIPRTIGVYEICVVAERRSYFGQSLDVQGRLRDHWDALANGLHSNPELQRHWKDYGSAKFEARLVAKAPTNLADLQLSRWLVMKERASIEARGGMKNVINAEWPQPVLNDEAKRQLESLRTQYRNEMDALESAADRLSDAIFAHEERRSELKQMIADSRKWWGLFTDDEVLSNAKRAPKEIAALEKEIERVSAERQRKYARHDELKELLFL